ncbi:MAG TPA: hypothetical protein PKE04_13435, partial [Clostridia bacterium]|nr:hypothetical protein [Clostridia bacterium]
MVKKVLSGLLACLLVFSLAGAYAQEAYTYPMDTEVELKIFSSIFANSTTLGYANVNDMPIIKYIQEATGVSAVWDTTPAGTDSRQLFNTMVASGTLADYDIVIMSTINSTNASQLLEDDVIIGLNDHLASVPSYVGYYAFYCMRESGWANTYVGPLIRQDWLDALGLEAPTDFEGWDTVLRAFKEQYGAVFTSTLARVNSYGISGAFDAYGSFTMVPYLDDEGRVQVGQVQPEWKEYMAALARWYADGIIDHDMLTNDDAAVRTKALNEETGLIILNLGSVDMLNKQANEAGLSAKWVGCGYPTNAQGVVPWMQGNPDVTAENYNV